MSEPTPKSAGEPTGSPLSKPIPTPAQDRLTVGTTTSARAAAAARSSSATPVTKSNKLGNRANEGSSSRKRPLDDAGNDIDSTAHKRQTKDEEKASSEDSEGVDKFPNQGTSLTPRQRQVMAQNSLSTSFRQAVQVAATRTRMALRPDSKVFAEVRAMRQKLLDRVPVDDIETAERIISQAERFALRESALFARHFETVGAWAVNAHNNYFWRRGVRDQSGFYITDEPIDHRDTYMLPSDFATADSDGLSNGKLDDSLASDSGADRLSDDSVESEDEDLEPDSDLSEDD